MKDFEKKEGPLAASTTNVGQTQKQYYTAEEAMAFMEPRIRAMFQ
jgi:hypothetical protein